MKKNYLFYAAALLILFLGFWWLRPQSVTPSSPFEFTLKLPYGIKNIQGQQDLISSENTDFILVNFFATWCPYCRLEISELKKLSTQFPKLKILLIGVDESETESLLREYQSQFEIPNSITILDSRYARDFGYQGGGIPQLFLFNANGVKIKEFVGFTPAETLLEKLQLSKNQH